ncbi:toprim domain-containing protein [Siphonobacter sp. SORGH_AS_1065]|uniref:toprim domain-containing protein n=1 Tax=Siphonobacter sp. SORGH_AS_1065 TaxID=3041795 RepID=UPI0027818761|nr:toprim domain-containing protein [Siphonobacter sp. SORGH_AS_1065]MDQ1090446.1 hypothetical protein [Siphonobacter sp. SORGH_AS_1065]
MNIGTRHNFSLMTDLTSDTQKKVLSTLNLGGVEYIAFSDFALRKYVDSRYFNTIKLWVNPTEGNYQKLQDAFKLVNKILPLEQNKFYTRTEKPLLTVGPHSKQVEIYNSAPGLHPDFFNHIYKNKKILGAGLIAVPVLNENDLYRTLLQTPKKGADIQLLEGKYPQLLQDRHQTNQVRKPVAINWNEVAPQLDPYRLLTDSGFKHIPAKGLIGSSRSQTFTNGDTKVVMYPNNDGGRLPFFLDQTNSRRGGPIDFLTWVYKNNYAAVNQYLIQYLGGIENYKKAVPVAVSDHYKKSTSHATSHLTDQEFAQIRLKELQENYQVRTVLNNPAYLVKQRALALPTIYSPEFYKQIVDSKGFNLSTKQSVEVHNTAFPMRNEYGITTLILRNANFKGFPAGERRDGLWISNPVLRTKSDLKFQLKNNSGEPVDITLPKGTKGVLLKNQDNDVEKFTFYFNDPAKVGREVPYNKVTVAGNQLDELTKALHPLQVQRIVVTENPIDAISFHQISPPATDENRMYISTGGQPSHKQIEYLNRIIKEVQPNQVLLGMDNEKEGMKFNILLLGGIQHPAIPQELRIRSIVREREINDAEAITKPKEFVLTLEADRPIAELIGVADRIASRINSYVPEGLSKSASVEVLKSDPGISSQIAIVFPKEEKNLLLVQKELVSISSQNAQAEIFKIVRPLNKDFNEDLKEIQQKKSSISYELGEIPHVQKRNTLNVTKADVQTLLELSTFSYAKSINQAGGKTTDRTISDKQSSSVEVADPPSIQDIDKPVKRPKPRL